MAVTESYTTCIEACRECAEACAACTEAMQDMAGMENCVEMCRDCWARCTDCVTRMEEDSDQVRQACLNCAEPAINAPPNANATTIRMPSDALRPAGAVGMSAGSWLRVKVLRYWVFGY